eukprot:5790516-Alexandrium_andersonii.AAC.1
MVERPVSKGTVMGMQAQPIPEGLAAEIADASGIDRTAADKRRALPECEECPTEHMSSCS